MSETVPILINDREYRAPLGARLIDAILELTGEEIPRFCYHRDLPVVGSCRMCQVEVEAPVPGGSVRRALAISCRTPVGRDMKVWTQSPAAQRARQGVLEFLLKDHPLDCPICDKAGECPLQDYTYREGQSEGRSHDPRRKRRKRVSLGDVIVLDQERCVLCTRCVRFFPAVEKREQLQVVGIGNRSAIATFDDRPLAGDYQGNLADICPVGALTLRKFRFQARVWNVRPTPSTCPRCSRGCAVEVGAYRGRVVRVRPRHDPQVNGSWMCDRGRFGFDDANLPGRLATAVQADPGPLADLGLEGGAARAAEWLQEAGPEALLVASPYLTLEEGEAFLELARTFAAPALFLAPQVAEGDGILWTGDPAPNRRGLADLGLEAVAPAHILARLPAAACLLAGEKILHFLCGLDPLDASAAPPPLAAGQCSIVLDTHLREGFALCLPARTWAEKEGRLRNLQGLERRLRPALPAPPGVPDGAELLRRIASAAAPRPRRRAPATSGAAEAAS